MADILSMATQAKVLRKAARNSSLEARRAILRFRKHMEAIQALPLSDRQEISKLWILGASTPSDSPAKIQEEFDACKALQIEIEKLPVPGGFGPDE